MPPLDRPPRGKADRKMALSARALEDLAAFLPAVDVPAAAASASASAGRG
jgi:hypothetical protein